MSKFTDERDRIEARVKDYEAKKEDEWKSSGPLQFVKDNPTLIGGLVVIIIAILWVVLR